ncbi:MAG: NAD(P)-dependent dehydrogenase (short-subunit alcohol dehydrogenase family), partial [Myxococcota bacterium]
YGVDELDPDYELEADLGVDTVKQAEIFGLIRERYGLEQNDEFKLADYPTIRALAGWVGEQLGSTAPTPAEPAAPVVPEPTTTSEPPERSGRLTQWVSDTLPDEDLPRLDTDLAEASKEDAPATPAADTSIVLPTLLAIVAEKTGYGVDELDPDYELEADLGVDTVKQAEIFGSVREKLGLDQDDEFNLADHPTIAGLAGYLSSRVAAGAPVEEPPVAEQPVAEPSLDDDPSSEEAPGPFDSPTPLNLETFDDPHGLPEPRSIAKPVDPNVLPASFRIRRPVLVDSPAWAIGSLSGRTVKVLGAGPLAASLKAELKRRGAKTSGRPDAVIDADADVIRSFHAARALDSHRPTDWVCASLIGADPTVVPAEIAVRIGARAGFTKALNQEWSECAARLVDVHPSLSDPKAARLLCDELAARDGAVEIFHHGGRRLTMALQLEPMPTSGQPLTNNPVIVLTGGTRGITARIALEFAHRGPCRLALLARTAPAGAPLDEGTTRAEIRAALQESGHRGTPAEIETRMKPLRSADEVRQNIAKLTEAGAEVMFVSVDLSDPVTIHGALERVRTNWGRIDGVVHGAGAEESRLIIDKDENDFRRIFDGKALGGLALAEALSEQTWLVSMGSVAGRFGNPGQVDYAAANEAMARVCLGRARSLHVDWTAWGDVGMASRGGMDTLLVSRGIELLPAAPGAALLVDMVLEEMWGEKVVAGRLGDMTSACDHPLLDTLRYEGDGVVAERLLSLTSDPWIADHAIDGVPVLPGVIGLEMMAAVATRCRPSRAYCGTREVSFSAPIKLYRDEPTRLIVHAEPEGSSTIRCTLSSQRTAKTGRVLTTEHFSALIELRAELSPKPLPPAIAFDTRIDQSEIYQRFFHGPSFQVLESASGVTADGLEAEILVDHGLVSGGLITAPLILEAAFQAAGLHRMVVDGERALPARIKQVSLLTVPKDGASLWALVRRVGDHYDIDVSSGSAPVMRIRGFEMVATDPLPPEGRFEAPEGGWPAAIIAQASFEAPPSRLPADEQAALTARGTPRRQRDRIAGRLAARAAVRALTGAQDADFSIDNDPLGRPRVDLPEDIRISITHRSGEAMAVAARGGWPGIDVERIEPRDPAFAKTWFTPTERLLSGNDPFRQTLIWATKEAVLKALGTGLRLAASEVEVTNIAPGRLTVRLGVAACWRVAYLDGQPPTVRWSRQGDDVIVTAFVADASLSVAFAAA